MWSQTWVQRHRGGSCRKWPSGSDWGRDFCSTLSRLLLSTSDVDASTIVSKKAQFWTHRGRFQRLSLSKWSFIDHQTPKGGRCCAQRSQMPQSGKKASKKCALKPWNSIYCCHLTGNLAPWVHLQSSLIISGFSNHRRIKFTGTNGNKCPPPQMEPIPWQCSHFLHPIFMFCVNSTIICSLCRFYKCKLFTF